jgi:methylmalonyl-CoA mutase, N-terminal domain
VEEEQRLIVGVNAFQSDQHVPVETLKIDDEVAQQQIARLRKVKAERDQKAVDRALAKVEAAARGTDNLMPPVLEAVRAYATLGEVSDVFRKVWGQYREGGAF